MCEKQNSLAAGIVMVDAVTDEVPVRSFKVPRNQHSKLDVASIDKSLVNRGLVLLAIDTDNGYPSCKDAWTLKTYDTSPIQLCVGRKPGACPYWIKYVFVVGCVQACAN